MYCSLYSMIGTEVIHVIYLTAMYVSDMAMYVFKIAVYCLFFLKYRDVIAK